MTKITLTPEARLLTGRERLPLADDDTGDWKHALAGGYDIVVLAGQSNEVGFSGGGTIDARIDWPHDRIFQWSPTGGNDSDPAYAQRLLKASDPLLWPGLQAAPEWGDEWGPAPGTWLARHLLPFIAPGRSIVLVPAAVGGTTIDDWAVDGVWLGPQTIASVTSAVRTLPNARVLAFSWTQGEAQVLQGTDPEEYQTKLEALVDGFRAQIPTASDAPFLIGAMVPEWIGNNELALAIDDVHRRMPLHRPRCWYIQAPAGSYAASGNIHFSEAGQRERGRRGAVKLITAAMQSDGAMLGAPSNVRVMGATVTWAGPASDAPLYAVEHRPFGSTDPWTRIVHSPKAFSETGGDVSFTFDDLSGDIEVRIASLYADKESAFTAPVRMSFVLIPQPTFDLDIANAVLSDGQATSVPSLGTDATAWTAPAGEGPGLVDVNTRKWLACTTANSHLVYPTAPTGSYTFEVVVEHTDFALQGAYLSESLNAVPFAIWRGGDQSRSIYCGQAGQGDYIVVGQLVAGETYILHEVYDQAAQILSLYINGELVGQHADVQPPTPNGGGILFNALPGGSGGNNARYGAVKGWIGTALDQDQVTYRTTLLTAELDLTLGALV